MSIGARGHVQPASAILRLIPILHCALCVSASGPVRAQTHPQTAMVPMRDGVKLATDIYLPAGKGPFPTVLMRTPYNKNQAVGIAPQAIARGFALVAQDCRGRFGSQGANMPFATDGWNDGKHDGHDSVEWIAKQSWSNGKVGTWGGSALGITQLLMAGTTPPHLTCQYIVVGAPSGYQDMVYPGGVFKRAMVEDWLKATSFSSDALKTWVSHPTYDSYWRARDLATRWSKVNVPAMHVGGWYDIFTQGTLDSYMGFQRKGGPGAEGRQRLIMGPWTHGVGSRKAGALTYPANASAPPDRTDDPWRWFEHYLQGKDNGIDREPAVTYYVMGDVTDPKAPGNEWRSAADWPIPSTTTSYYLRSDRTLMPSRPRAGDSPLTYRYDPKDPTPGIGGPQLTISAGPQDQARIEQRSDVLAFTSAPLSAPLQITGHVTAELWIASDAVDTDFFVRLCDVYPDLRSFNVCEGQIRARFRDGFGRQKLLTPGRPYKLKVDLWSTSIILNKGHRLRVDVASASVPGYDPNPNTGAPFRASAQMNAARNTVFMDATHASRIILPVVADVGRKAEATASW